ncbi:Phosphatidylglycerophosphatase A [bacterium HR08]|nr:Phosphatidylglycerophosphatase A [bacterium HR08]
MKMRAHVESLARVRRSSEGGIVSLADRVAWWIAIGGGVGLAPIAPGTVGALLGLGLFALGFWFDRALGAVGVSWIIAGILLGIGTWASSRAVRLSGTADPPQIVVDEIVGQFLALLVSVGGRALWRGAIEGSVSWPGWGILWTSFGLFRLFDIWKPYPIRRVERWKGGAGVMADDVLAGICAGFATVLLVELSP